MSTPYEWASKAVPQGWWCLGDVAAILGVSVWTARRRLKREGLGVLFIKRWRDPLTGVLYGRRAWGVRDCEIAWLVTSTFEASTRDLYRRAPQLRRPFPSRYRQSKWRLHRLVQRGRKAPR